jgi:pyridoxine 5-phosphate synthase
MSTKLSVNINKIATLRNARGGNLPDVIKVAKDCEQFGADGITVHPRPDERHITTKDVYELAKSVTTEYNIEGYPNARFMDFMTTIRPAQATLVPDGPNVLTSSSGWDTRENFDFLKDITTSLKSMGIRVSIFMGTDHGLIEQAANIGCDRIEFYTGPYADQFQKDRQSAIQPYVSASKVAIQNGLGINAGHDLNLDNLAYFRSQIPELLEVSIGHALVTDALYFGLENTIKMYQHQLSING